MKNPLALALGSVNLLSTTTNGRKDVNNFFKTAFLATLIATAYSQTVPEAIKQGHALEEAQMVGAYNMPARFDVKGASDFEAFASFLVWQALEGGLDIGSYTDSGNRTQIIKMDSDYAPGFQLGLAYNSGFDDWKASLKYTFLYTSSKSHFSSSEVLATPFWIYNDNTADNAKINADHDFHINHFDLIASRPFYSGTKLTLDAGFGFKAAIDKQEISITHYKLDNDTTIVKTTDSNWFLGPKMGCNINFLLPYGLKVAGNGAAALLYQHHDIKYNIKDSDSPALNTATHNDYNFFAPAVELSLGLGWGSYFQHRSWHFELFTGYEMQHFFEQNVLRETDDLVRVYTDGKHGDLTLQGLTIRCDFIF